MKTWDDWSDFDLSLSVAKFVAQDGVVVDSGDTVHMQDYSNGVCLGWRAFCINRWEDMGPIIVDNGVSLIKIKGGYQAISEYWNYIDISERDEINDCCIGHDVDSYGHTNPLRAAAIVFLMMNGLKP